MTGLRPLPLRQDTTVGRMVTLAHGGGGRAMRALIESVFIQAFGTPDDAPLDEFTRSKRRAPDVWCLRLRAPGWGGAS